MNLEKHSTWDIYEELTGSLEQFVKSIVPEIKLREEVSEDVVKAYGVIRSLLKHSYYEYEFVDVAVAKILQTFEMALKIRYKELTQSNWPKSKPLVALIDWFRDGFYFENNDKAYLDCIRSARNYYSHPKHHGFGGIALFHWFDSVTDLINDLYGDVEQRKHRLDKTEKLNDKIQEIVKDGAIVDLLDEKFITYNAKILLIKESKSGTDYLFYFKVLYDLDNNGKLIDGQKTPLRILDLKNHIVEFDIDKCLFEPFLVRKINDVRDKEKYDDWITRLKKDKHYSFYDSSLSQEIEKFYKKKRRESLHSKNFAD
jgi:hypothetical protein